MELRNSAVDHVSDAMRKMRRSGEEPKEIRIGRAYARKLCKELALARCSSPLGIFRAMRRGEIRLFGVTVEVA